MIGRTLGPYKIIEQLGKGGMGVHDPVDDHGAPRRGHFEKLDPERMLTELTAFRYITQALVVEPVTSLPEVDLKLKGWKEPKSPCE